MTPLPDIALGPFTGGTFWALTAAALTIAVKRLRVTFLRERLPLFAAGTVCLTALQCVALPAWPPAAGLHFVLSGALGLSMLVGPYAAFAAGALALTAQACCWATAGFFSVGLTIFAANFLACFVVYPFVFRPLEGFQPDAVRTALAACLSGIAATVMGGALLWGALLTSQTAAPLASAVYLLPLTLSAGLGEGLLTAVWAVFLRRAHPQYGTAPWRVRTLAGLLLALGGAFCLLSTQFPVTADTSIADSLRRSGTPLTTRQGEPYIFLQAAHTLLASRLQPAHAAQPEGKQPAATALQAAQPRMPAAGSQRATLHMGISALAGGCALALGLLLFRRRKV